MKHIVPRGTSVDETLDFFEKEKIKMRQKYGGKVKDGEFYGALLQVCMKYFSHFGLQGKVLKVLKGGKK